MNPAELIALYTPRDMIKAMLQNPRPITFLRDLLIGGRVTEHDTEIIEIDITKGGRSVAAYVSRVGEANVVGKKGFSTNLHVIPYVYEEIPFTAKDVKTRLAGETIYASGANNRLDLKIGEWLGTLSDRLEVLEEQQLAEIIQTGKLVVSGKGVDYEVDFQMDGTHLVTNTGADNWGSGTEDKIKQLEDGAAVIRETGAPNPTHLILDPKAAADFLNDEAVLKYMDLKNVEMGRIDPMQLAGQFATYLGTFRRVGLQVEVYSYQGVYDKLVNGSLVNTPYLGANKAILTSPAVDYRGHYGALENLKTRFVGQRYPDIIIDPTGRNGSVTMESSPMAACHQPDGIYTLTTKS